MENNVTNSRMFPKLELSEALTFSESLRKRRRQGAEISHISISSEDSNIVGQMGVDVTGPDYDWKKRRV